MTQRPPIAFRFFESRRLLLSALAFVLVLAGTSGIAFAVSERTSGSAISARLSKKSFTASKARSVKLTCKFSKKSGSFSYLLTLKKGSKWQTVKSVKKKSYSKGAYKTTVKKVFGGKSVKLGSYRLKLSTVGGSKLLTFKVVKSAKPATSPDDTPNDTPGGDAPVNLSLPTISGTARQGQTLTASNGGWQGAASYTYQWRRCDSAGNNCSNVSGAVSSSFLLQATDVGKTIRASVTADNAYGSTSAISNQTQPVVSSDLIKEISAGGAHSCALLNDGTVKCWGNNGNGQLGDGTTGNRSIADDVSGITDAVQISAGDYDTCVVLSSKKVNCWGGVAKSSTPVEIASIANAAQVSVGSYFNCVLSDGKVSCWGSNSFGLGDGSTTSSSTPVNVSGITNALAVSVGNTHACALLSGGSVTCWGENGTGQLGDGTLTNKPTPVPVQGIDGAGTLSNAIAVSVGDAHSCALLANRTVTCWGDGYYGQLGGGSRVGDYPYPIPVSGITNASQLNTGGNHSCARLSDGKVKCWGWNYKGQLGDGTKVDNSTPVEVGGLTGASQVSGGGGGTFSGHTCALVSGNTVKCWGDNNYGQLGNGWTASEALPVEVSGLTSVAQISAGWMHSCAIASGGLVTCWGLNAHGQLGDTTTTDRSTPVGAGGITNAASISAGTDHTCAALSDKTVKCWGANATGQLGDGIGDHGHEDAFGGDFSPTPVVVSEIATATQVSVGTYHSCALLGTTVKCWGSNSYGQLGREGSSSSTPVGVTGIDNAVEISAGDYHTCARLLDGKVKCWGWNPYGQLGTDPATTTSSWAAIEVGISNAIALDAGTHSTCAVVNSSGTDGPIKCWGFNENGQLGNGSTSDSFNPVDVGEITNATDVSIGYRHSCAGLSGGAVKCWGSGVLGNGTTESLIPVFVSGLSDAIQLSAGTTHTCAVRSSGKASCWGANGNGQLGNGEMGYSLSPVSVIGLTS